MTSPISKDLAAHIVRRMGETGQPPERGALHVNVATDRLLGIWNEEYVRKIREDGRLSTFKFIEAGFGGGKTHFLYCMRELAWREGFWTSFVVLSPEECPFDKTLLVYRAIVRNVEYPPDSEYEESARGLDVALTRLIETRKEEVGAAAVRSWIDDELGRAPVESLTLRRAVQLYARATLDRDYDACDMLAHFLRGEELTSVEMTKLQLREVIDEKSAFRCLRSLTQIFRALGLPGFALFFDEADRNLALSARRRRAIGDGLRQMMDLCNGSKLPATFIVYAIPPQFRETVVNEYPALAQRMNGGDGGPESSPLAPMIDLERLNTKPRSLMLDIGMRLTEICGIADGRSLNMEIQRTNMDRLALEFDRRSLETGSRRLFVKAAVAHLFKQLRNGESRLTDAEVQRLVGSARADATGGLRGETDAF